MGRNRYALAAVLPALALACGGLAAADWPVFMGDSGRTAFKAEQAYPPLTEAWSFDVQGDVTGGPVVQDGVVYFGARSGNVYALDALTGELLWDYSTEDWVDASPAVSSGSVYAAGRDGRLYALDRLTGQPRWSADLGGASVSSPLVLGGRVYAGGGPPGRKIRAFDAATGSLLWERQAAQPADSALSTDGTAVYAASNDGRVYAFDPATGADVWGSPGYYQTIGSFGTRAVAVSSGSLYALPGNAERKLFRLRASDKFQEAVTAVFADPVAVPGEAEVTSPVVSPYGIFAGAGSRPHTLYAFDRATLADLTFSSPTFGNTVSSGLLGSPAMVNEVLYLGTVDARLVAVSSTGAQLQEVALSSSTYSSPAVANGHVYVGVNGGRLYAFKAARVAAISSPRAYEVVDGTLTVRGYLKSSAMQGYALHYGEGEEPSPGAWTQISSAAAAAELSGAALGQWDVSQLSPGLYTLRLSVDETAPSGTLAQARVTVRVNHVPLPPSGLTAGDEPGDSGNRIRLNWTASPSAGVTAYRVYRDSGEGLALLGQVSAPSITYLDQTAATGETFAYAVSAWDGYGESVLSGQVSAAALDNDPSADAVQPSAVTGFSAVPGEPGRALLSWTGTGDDGVTGYAAGYEIRHGTYPAFAWESGIVWKSSRAVSGPSGTAESETVGGLYGGVTYYFLIKAYDDKPNYSAVSATASACAARDPFPPAAPGALSVADRGGDHGGALVLAWGRSADDGGGAGDVYGYRVFRAAAAGGTQSAVQYSSVPAGTLSFTDSAAPENVKYYYSVAAFDSTSESTRTAEGYGVSADNWRFFDATNGGTVRLADGAEVNISGNAVSQNDSILVFRREPADYFGPAARIKADAGGARATGIVYEVKFEDPATKLLKPVVISLPYTAAEIGAVPESSLRMYLLEGARWSLVNTSRVNTEARKVSAEVSHFSVYSLMGYVPSGALLASDSVYTYPNPARGDTLTFKFLPADTADITVDVYNVAGEKVARLEKAACPGGVTSEIVWRISNVASGVYVYRVEARGASGAKAVTKKLAIVH